MEHQIVQSDVEHVKRLGYNPTGWGPGFRGDNGKIHPHVTRMTLENGNLLSVFHVKPVYYETKQNTWRPLEEICTHHGNRKIIIAAEHFSKVHPRFIAWLEKRQQIVADMLLVEAELPVVEYVV